MTAVYPGLELEPYKQYKGSLGAKVGGQLTRLGRYYFKAFLSK